MCHSVHSQQVNVTDSSALKTDSAILLAEALVESYQGLSKLHKIPGSLTLTDNRQILLSDGTNLSYVLNSLPGLSMQSGTYATNRIVIRGMGSRTPYNTNRIRSYLNDFPITSSDGLSSPEEVDLHLTGRIEIIKGPSSALYGSGLGGTINLFTPFKRVTNWRIGFQYGSFNTLKTSLSGNFYNKHSIVYSSLSNLQSEGYRQNNQFRRTTFFTGWQWEKDKWKIQHTLIFMDVMAGIPSSLGKTLFENEPSAAAPNWNAVGGFKKYRKGLIGSHIVYGAGQKFSNKFSVFVKFNDGYEKRPFNNLDDQSAGIGFRDKLTLKFKNLEWISGLEIISESYQWKIDTTGVSLNKNRELRYHFNLFSLIYYKPSEKLNISLAGALNHSAYQLKDLFPENGNQSGKRIFPLIISPRLGINFAPDDHLAFYASAGKGFSLPSPEETLLPGGDVNPDIEPEQGWQIETGFRVALFNRRCEIDATIYHIGLHNLLVTKRLTEDIFTGINAGKTNHTGFEILMNAGILKYRNFPGFIDATISYTASLNRFVEFEDDGQVFNGNELPGIPRQMGQISLVWKPMEFIQANIQMQYTGKQYVNDQNTLDYNGYFLGNIKVQTAFKTKKNNMIEIFTGLNNITNIHYASMLVVNALGFGASEPRYYYPGLPRNVYFGFGLQFN